MRQSCYVAQAVLQFSVLLISLPSVGIPGIIGIYDHPWLSKTLVHFSFFPSPSPAFFVWVFCLLFFWPELDIQETCFQIQMLFFHLIQSVGIFWLSILSHFKVSIQLFLEISGEFLILVLLCIPNFI